MLFRSAILAIPGSHTPVAAQGDANQLVPPGAFKDLKWRSVGATRGGRVTAYSGVRQQPHTFYFGGVGGGAFSPIVGGLTVVIGARPADVPHDAALGSSGGGVGAGRGSDPGGSVTIGGSP